MLIPSLGHDDPGGHDEHSVEPRTLAHLPTAHREQEVLPWAGCALPASHKVQASTPVDTLLYLPAPQDVQVSLSVDPYFPMGHTLKQSDLA